jgi:hypothetical protein
MDGGESLSRIGFDGRGGGERLDRGEGLGSIGFRRSRKPEVGLEDLG